MEYLITIGIVAAAVVLILICILSTWKKVPADKAAIVTGLGKAKVITGGGVIVIPVMQRIDYVTLENMSFDVNMQGTLTADAVPIEANGTVVVKIKNDETMIRSAVEQFNCGREAETRQHIVDTARDVCEGRLREIIADMTAEQLYKDRKTFSERVKEVAEEQLKELGLELKSFTIKGIGDQNGYFEALSKPQIAAAQAGRGDRAGRGDQGEHDQDLRGQARGRAGPSGGGRPAWPGGQKGRGHQKAQLRAGAPDHPGDFRRGVQHPAERHPEGHHQHRDGRQRPQGAAQPRRSARRRSRS